MALLDFDKVPSNEQKKRRAPDQPLLNFEEPVSVPKAALKAEPTGEVRPTTTPAPTSVIRSPKYWPGTIQEPDSGAVTQLLRRTAQRSGITRPGVVSKVAGAVMYPFSLAGELADVPFRAIHDYGPGEGGVSPGDVVEILPLLSAGGAGGTGILRQGARIASQKAVTSRNAINILADLRKAAQRGEAGFVSEAAAIRLHKMGVSRQDIVRKFIPILAKEQVSLAPIGPSKLKVSVEVDQAVSAVLGKISVGEKPARLIPSPGRIYANYVDEMNPLRKLLDKTVDSKKLIAAENPYETFRLLPGTWGKVDAFLSYRPFSMKSFKFEGKSLSEVIQPIRGDMGRFRAYYAARQALDLEKAGFKTGFKIDSLKTVVKGLNKPFKKTADELVRYNNRVLRTLLDSGIISSQEYSRMVAMHKRYAPMHRIIPDQDVVFSRSAQEAMRQRMMGKEGTKPLKRLSGSPADIADPLESVIRNTYIYLRAADRNMAMQSMMKLARKDKEFGKLFQKVKKVDDVEIVVPDEALEVMLKRNNISPATLKALSPSGFNPKSNTIAVWEKGKRIMYETHPDIVRVVKAMDKAEVGVLTRFLSVPARLLRAGATLSPEFIARNPIRDQLSAFVFSKYGYLPGIDFVRGAAHVLKRDDLYWKWKVAGGEHSMLVSLDRVALQKDLTRAIQKYGGLENEIMSGLNILNPVEALRQLSVLGEKGTRLGEFMHANKALGSSKLALQKAAFASREVTLDFARMGAKTRAMNMTIAFWNAQVQGMDKIGRAFKAAPLATSAKIASSITIPSVTLAVVNSQDGRWKDIPSWQKDLFWIIPSGFVSKADWKKMTANQKAKFNKEHTIFRVPKPFELGVVFGSGPERLVEYMMEQDPEIGNEYIKNLAQAASPGFLPTAVLPFAEIWANESFFTGSSIVPRGQEKVLPPYQEKFATTDVAKELSRLIADISGDATAPSPIHIDHLVRSWTGGLGYYALAAVDSLLQVAGVSPVIPEPEPKTFEKWPMVRAFIVRYPSAGVPAITRVFDEYDRMTKQEATGRKLLTEQKRSGYKFLETIEGLQYMRQRRTAISNALKFAAYVREHPTMAPKDKQQLIDSAMFGAIEIAKDALKVKALRSGERPPTPEEATELLHFD